jgi:hypothetical protein
LWAVHQLLLQLHGCVHACVVLQLRYKHTILSCSDVYASTGKKNGLEPAHWGHGQKTRLLLPESSRLGGISDLKSQNLLALSALRLGQGRMYVCVCICIC